MRGEERRSAVSRQPNGQLSVNPASWGILWRERNSRIIFIYISLLKWNVGCVPSAAEVSPHSCLGWAQLLCGFLSLTAAFSQFLCFSSQCWGTSASTFSYKKCQQVISAKTRVLPTTKSGNYVTTRLVQFGCKMLNKGCKSDAWVWETRRLRGDKWKD